MPTIWGLWVSFQQKVLSLKSSFFFVAGTTLVYLMCVRLCRILLLFLMHIYIYIFIVISSALTPLKILHAWLTCSVGGRYGVYSNSHCVVWTNSSLGWYRFIAIGPQLTGLDMYLFIYLFNFIFVIFFNFFFLEMERKFFIGWIYESFLETEYLLRVVCHKRLIICYFINV